eukprot:TRINITY_DN602_c0_g4_i2.p1 TRINITY_DN602_c0_g4~~TRINITY_DN602_c0_g4_i2.p1  ORF type:complete len:1787 (+),score=135.75 TRINITY_DN602_c0_g4_i2:308-5362(+)
MLASRSTEDDSVYSCSGEEAPRPIKLGAGSIPRPSSAPLRARDRRLLSSSTSHGSSGMLARELHPPSVLRSTRCGRRSADLWLNPDRHRHIDRLANRTSAGLRVDRLAALQAERLLRRYWRALDTGCTAPGAPPRGRLRVLLLRAQSALRAGAWAVLMRLTFGGQTAVLLEQRKQVGGHLLCTAGLLLEECEERLRLLRSVHIWLQRAAHTTFRPAAVAVCPALFVACSSEHRPEWLSQPGARSALRCLALLLGPRRLQAEPATVPRGIGGTVVAAAAAVLAAAAVARTAAEQSTVQACPPAPAITAAPAATVMDVALVTPLPPSPTASAGRSALHIQSSVQADAPDQPALDTDRAEQPALDTVQTESSGWAISDASFGTGLGRISATEASRTDGRSAPHRVTASPTVAPDTSDHLETSVFRTPEPSEGYAEVGDAQKPRSTGSRKMSVQPLPGPATRRLFTSQSSQKHSGETNSGGIQSPLAPDRSTCTVSMWGASSGSRNNKSTHTESTVSTASVSHASAGTQRSITATLQSEPGDETQPVERTCNPFDTVKARRLLAEAGEQPEVPRYPSASSVLDTCPVYQGDVQVQSAPPGSDYESAGTLVVRLPVPPGAQLRTCTVELTAQCAAVFGALDHPRPWRSETAVPVAMSMSHLALHWDAAAHMVVMAAPAALAASASSSGVSPSLTASTGRLSTVVHRLRSLYFASPETTELTGKQVSVSMHLPDVPTTDDIQLHIGRAILRITVVPPGGESETISCRLLRPPQAGTVEAELQPRTHMLTVTADVAQASTLSGPTESQCSGTDAEYSSAHTTEPMTYRSDVDAHLSRSMPVQRQTTFSLSRLDSVGDMAASFPGTASVVGKQPQIFRLQRASLATPALSAHGPPPSRLQQSVTSITTPTSASSGACGQAEHFWTGCYQSGRLSADAMAAPVGTPERVGLAMHFPGIKAGAELVADVNAGAVAVRRTADMTLLAAEAWLWPVDPNTTLADFEPETSTMTLRARVCLPGHPHALQGVTVPAVDEMRSKVIFHLSCLPSEFAKACAGSTRERLQADISIPAGSCQPEDVAVEMDDNFLRIKHAGLPRGGILAIVPLPVPVDAAESQAVASRVQPEQRRAELHVQFEAPVRGDTTSSESANIPPEASMSCGWTVGAPAQSLRRPPRPEGQRALFLPDDGPRLSHSSAPCSSQRSADQFHSSTTVTRAGSFKSGSPWTHSVYYSWSASSDSVPAPPGVPKQRRPATQVTCTIRRSRSEPERESIYVEIDFDPGASEELDVGVHESVICLHLAEANNKVEYLEIPLPRPIDSTLAVANFDPVAKLITVEGPVLPEGSSESASVTTPSTTFLAQAPPSPGVQRQQWRPGEQQQQQPGSTPAGPEPPARMSTASSDLVTSGPHPPAATMTPPTGEAPSAKESSPAAYANTASFTSTSAGSSVGSQSPSAMQGDRFSVAQYVEVLSPQGSAQGPGRGRIRSVHPSRTVVQLDDGPEVQVPLAALQPAPDPVSISSWVVIVGLERAIQYNGSDGVVGALGKDGTVVVVLKDDSRIRVSLFNVKLASRQSGRPPLVTVHGANGVSIGYNISMSEPTEWFAAVPKFNATFAADGSTPLAACAFDASELEIQLLRPRSPGGGSTADQDQKLGALRFRLPVRMDAVEGRYQVSKNELHLAAPCDARALATLRVSV